MKSQKDFSRRTFLSATGMALAVVMPQPAGAVSNINEISVTPLANVPMEPILPGEGQPILYAPQGLGYEIKGSIPAGTAVQIQFDERMYRICDTQVIKTNLENLGHKNVNISHTEQLLSLRYTENTVASGESIIVGKVRTNNYPYDLVGNPHLGNVGSIGKTAASIKKKTLKHEFKDTPFSTWGVEVGVMWRTLPGRPEEVDEYRVPLAISLRSVGPGPIPPGGYIEIRTDPRIVGNIKPKVTAGPRALLGGPAENFSTSSCTGLRWRIRKEIPAGTVAMMKVDCDFNNYGHQPADAKITTIDFIADEKYSASQRTTGRESLRHEEYHGPYIYMPVD